jgi:hypothetical protein
MIKTCLKECPVKNAGEDQNIPEKNGLKPEWPKLQTIGILVERVLKLAQEPLTYADPGLLCLFFVSASQR